MLSLHHSLRDHLMEALRLLSTMTTTIAMAMAIATAMAMAMAAAMAIAMAMAMKTNAKMAMTIAMMASATKPTLRSPRMPRCTHRSPRSLTRDLAVGVVHRALCALQLQAPARDDRCSLDQ